VLEHLIGTVWPRDADPKDALVAAVTQVCDRYGVTLATPWPTNGPGWQGLAWRAASARDTPPWQETLRAAGNDLGADIAVSNGALATSGPALVVSDVDSTFFEGEVIDDLAGHAGSQDLVAAITARAMKGDLDFRQSLYERVAVLRGLDVASLDAVRRAVRLAPGAGELTERLRELGVPLGLVSGGFGEIVAPLAEELGIGLVRANALAHGDGLLTGELAGDIIDADAKVATARQWAAELGADLERVVTIGDGANDLPMLRAAGLGVAYCAKPIVVARAPSALNFPRLDALLGLLGHSSH